MKRFRHLLYAAVIPLFTAGCAVTFTPERIEGRASAVATVDASDRVINAYLGLRAFPGSRVLASEFDGRDSETRFEADASLAQVYEHLHRQLVAAGWRRVELEVESDEIEAEYLRAGLELELELELLGPGRFELELDVD